MILARRGRAHSQLLQSWKLFGKSLFRETEPTVDRMRCANDTKPNIVHGFKKCSLSPRFHPQRAWVMLLVVMLRERARNLHDKLWLYPCVLLLCSVYTSNLLFANRFILKMRASNKNQQFFFVSYVCVCLSCLAHFFSFAHFLRFLSYHRIFFAQFSCRRCTWFFFSLLFFLIILCKFV